LVLSADGKGIVMRPGSLRKETAKAAAAEHHKLKTRLSGGEKKNRKRMAEIGAVYDITPVPRSASDILARRHDGADKAPAPTATNKWCVASVVDDTATVINQIFDEADRRDPDHERAWVALVDGNNHQVDTFAAQAKARNIKLPVLIDFIHVLEYIWGAAWCFFDQGDRAAETRPTTRPLRSSPARRPWWPPRSAARPPTTTSRQTSGSRPTVPPTTSLPRLPTSTTRPPWSRAGPSPRGSSKALAVILLLTQWTGPVPDGGSRELKPF